MATDSDLDSAWLESERRVDTLARVEVVVNAQRGAQRPLEAQIHEAFLRRTPALAVLILEIGVARRDVQFAERARVL